MSKQFMSLDEARVISMLSTNITYCQLKVGGKNKQVLVVNGVPFEYRTFCSLMISKLGGDIPARLREEFSNQMREFWDSVQYKHATLETDSTTWMVLGVFNQAIMAVNGSSDNIFDSADYLETLKSVSRLLHEEKQLRLGDVNDNRVVA